MSLLREKIAANRELAARLNALLSHIPLPDGRGSETPPRTPLDNAYTHVIRNYSAVTAACMATRIDVLEATGGFDEQFAIDYNDIDFCLKAIQQGYDVVYTPYAELYHFEGTSIHRKVQDPREVELFQQRWASFMERDPFYNPNLTRTRADFAIDPRASGWSGTGKRVRAARHK